ARLRKTTPAALCSQALEGLCASRHGWTVGGARQSADRAHPRDGEAASGLPTVRQLPTADHAGSTDILLKKTSLLLILAVACLSLLLRHHRTEEKVEIAGTQEIRFHSRALDREMSYWVVLPEDYQNRPSQQYPVLYMLHGHGGAPTESVQNSHLLEYIRPQHWILVMPDGKDSYYTNAAEKTGDRFEDYIVRDLVSDVEGKFRVVPKRDGRMLAGISMGGFGAEKIGLRHPEAYRLIGALSSPADATRRKFS